MIIQRYANRVRVTYWSTGSFSCHEGWRELHVAMKPCCQFQLAQARSQRIPLGCKLRVYGAVDRVETSRSKNCVLKRIKRRLTFKIAVLYIWSRKGCSHVHVQGLFWTSRFVIAWTWKMQMHVWHVKLLHKPSIALSTPSEPNAVFFQGHFLERRPPAESASAKVHSCLKLDDIQ